MNPSIKRTAWAVGLGAAALYVTLLALVRFKNESSSFLSSYWWLPIAALSIIMLVRSWGPARLGWLLLITSCLGFFYTKLPTMERTSFSGRRGDSSTAEADWVAWWTSNDATITAIGLLILCFIACVGMAGWGKKWIRALGFIGGFLLGILSITLGPMYLPILSSNTSQTIREVVIPGYVAPGPTSGPAGHSSANPIILHIASKSSDKARLRPGEAIFVEDRSGKTTCQTTKLDAEDERILSRRFARPNAYLRVITEVDNGRVTKNRIEAYGLLADELQRRARTGEPQPVVHFLLENGRCP